MSSKPFWISVSSLNGKSKWLALELELICILMIFLSILTLRDYQVSQRSKVNLNKQIPFMCTTCKQTKYYKISELQCMQKTEFTHTGQASSPTTATATAPARMNNQIPTTNPASGVMMGPMMLECSKCKTNTLTQAVECPKCREIFVMKMDPAKGLFDDKCPKCHESYAKSWQEKYRQSQEKE